MGRALPGMIPVVLVSHSRGTYSSTAVHLYHLFVYLFYVLLRGTPSAHACRPLLGRLMVVHARPKHPAALCLTAVLRL